MPSALRPCPLLKRAMGKVFARLARFEVDVKGHTFECYVADVTKKNGAGKTDSSDAIPKA